MVQAVGSYAEPKHLRSAANFAPFFRHLPGCLMGRRNSLASLKGKTVKLIRKQLRGHYDYIEYVVTFSDGTKVRFSGNSSADVECVITPPRGQDAK